MHCWEGAGAPVDGRGRQFQQEVGAILSPKGSKESEWEVDTFQKGNNG